MAQQGGCDCDFNPELVFSCCHITTNSVASNNMDLLSYDSPGQKSNMGLIELKSRFQLTQSPLLGTGLPRTHGWGRPETLEATQNSVYHIHLYLLQLVTSGIIFIILLLALHLLCLYYLFVTISDVKWLPKRHQCRQSKRLRFNPWVGKIPWRRAWQPMSIFLPGESHEQRSLAG